MKEAGSRQPTDDRLMRAVADGDTRALALLYDRHAPWLSLRLARRCHDPGLVDEVVQDTFLSVWRGAGRFQTGTGGKEGGEGAVGGWIWTIAARRLVDALRVRRNRSEATEHVPSDRAPSAEEQVLGEVAYGDAGGALAQLSPELRAVLQATVIDGYSTREASLILGIPEGTVKTRTRRALSQLRACLEIP